MTTILYSPSVEEILALAKENPELNIQIKEKVLAEVKSAGLKYVKNRFQKNADKVYSDLFKKIEAKHFKRNSYGEATGLDETTEKSLIAAIENKFVMQIEQEFNDYINSDEFKRKLKSELQLKLASAIVKNLDAEIKAQAEKLTLV